MKIGQRSCLLAGLLVLFVIAGCGGGGGGSDTGTIVWTVPSSCSSPINVKFFDATTNQAGPDTFSINDGQTLTQNLSCTVGDKICYGAATDASDIYFWGVGIDGTKPCTDCCTTCASDTQTFTATALSCSTGTLSWNIQNNSSVGLNFKFFDVTSNLVWPDSPNVFSLDNGQSVAENISCNIGDKVCYGASTDMNDTHYWGVGINGTKGCTDCCYICTTGAQSVTVNLTY